MLVPFLTVLHLSLILLPLSLALPDPALFQQQHPHQVGFPLPPPQSPPYGKSLPASSLSPARHWTWTSWLTDARQTLKGLLGISKHQHKKQKHTKQQPKQQQNSRLGHDEDERKVGRFDNDIVLRVNVTSLEDRIIINELADVSFFALLSPPVVLQHF
jgi:hypothetical protein